MEIKFKPQALAELLEAQAWYKAISPHAYYDFEESLERTFNFLLAFPNAGSPWKYGASKTLTPDFPYAVYFMIVEDTLWIVALRHAKQDQKNIERRFNPFTINAPEPTR